MLKSKLFVGLTLFVFFVVTTSTLTAGFITKNKEGKLKSSSAEPGDTLGSFGGNGSGNSKGVATSTITLTQDFVAKHSNLSDCYIIIDNIVYDVSSFLSSHPGGSEQIIPYCGKDASRAFNTKDKNPSGKHSTLANNMLKDYLIGKLGDNITVSTPVVSNPSNTPTSAKKPIGKVLPITLPTKTPQVPPINNATTLTADEVSKHNTQIDCWMIISGNVYNLSAYISMHPGGLIVTASCGKDGTTAFSTQGGKGTHSGYANNLLGSYLLGSLNSATSNTQNNSVPGGSASTNPSNPTISPIQSQGSTGNLPASILSQYPNAVYISGKYEDEGEWEGKVNVSGTCKAIKTSSSGSIIEDKNC